MASDEGHKLTEEEYPAMEREAVSVVCGQPLFAGNRKGSLLNPSRIVEGLSPSTENYNRSRKFENHRSIESLADCILVSQDRMLIADFRIRTFCNRDNSHWNPIPVHLRRTRTIMHLRMSVRPRRRVSPPGLDRVCDRKIEMINRRSFSIQAALASGMILQPRQALAGVASYRQDFPNMLLSYLAGQLNELAAKWDRERSAISSSGQLHARNRLVREKLREMIHGLPEKNPLGPVVAATHDRDGYRVENVMFQSRPNFWVTANLYVPKAKGGPFPGIISPCGHSPLGRQSPAYQCMYTDLARSGFVVLAYDPIGQGERRQYWNPRTNRTEVDAAPIFEHSMPGQVLLLMGEDLTHYRIWDGMRAIDYLLTRPEVDGHRIGCAGHSGGGTLTKFISALDERVACAVICEGGSTNRWPFHPRPGDRIGPSDIEQNLFPAALLGVDAHDLQVAIAPRPLLVLIENYSPAFLAAAERIRARYRLLGSEEKFATEEATDPHAWTPKLRLATTNWYCRWFYGRSGPAAEPDFAVESPETLNCLPNGSIRYSRKGDTIFTLLRKHGETLPPAASQPASPAEIARLIDYRRIEQPLGIRAIVTTRRRHYQIEKLEFLSEPGIYIPAWVFLPDQRQPGPAILYVDQAGKEAEGLEFGLLEELARSGRVVVAVDVRGAGATKPPYQDGWPGEFGHLFSVETAMTYMAWFMDRSLFGMRVQDVVRSVDYMLSRADVEKSGVQAIGRGEGALWVLFAAALDPRIQSIVAERGLVSYDSLTKVDRYRHSAGIFIRDVLKHFDLPQVAASVAPRRLTLLSPLDPMKNPVALPEAEQVYHTARRAYQVAGAADRLRIAGESNRGAPLYLKLLGGA